MSNSPIHADLDMPSFTIKVDGSELKGTYEVISVEVIKEINKIPFAEVCIADGSVEDETFEISESNDLIPGKEVDLLMGYDGTEASVFKGVITSQDIRVRNYGGTIRSELRFKAHDKAIKATIGKKSAYFKDKKDSEIITTCLGNAGVSKTVKATTNKHAMVVQYDCTDWDFVLTRAEINGMVVVIEDGKVEVGPPTVSGSAVLDLNFGKDVIDFHGEMDARTQLASVESYAWDGTKLKVEKGASTEPSAPSHGNITGKKLSDVAAPAKYEMRTPVPEPAAVLKEWSKAKLLYSRMAKIRGKVTFPGSNKAKIGKLIKLEGFGARFNGTAYVSRVYHKLEAGNWQTKVGFGLPPEFFTEKVNPSGQLPASGLISAIKGLHVGKVKKIDSDPDGEYRVQVDIPMVKETGDGVWARMVNPYASNKIGSYWYPEKGDEVIVGFLNEDPRFAIVLGMLYGKKMAPPWTPDDKNTNKGWVTKSKLKLYFDDDKKELFIETPGKNKITVSDDAKGIKLEDQNKNKINMSSSGITIESAKSLTLKAKQAVTIEGTSNVSIKSKTGNATVEGNNVTCKGKIGFTGQGSAKAELKASGQTTVKGAMVMIN